MEEAGVGKVSWLYNKGKAVGKGILVTSVVVSSAPFVLPPLLVFSAFGFACAVPCGLYLASYACAEKLMSKLLPGTRPPRFLLDYEERDYDGVGTENCDGVVGNLDLEKDTKHGVKRRFDVLAEDNEQEERVSNGYAFHNEQNKEEELEANASENLEVDGYEEDMGEYADHEKQKPNDTEIEVLVEEEKQVPLAVKAKRRAPLNEVQGLVIVIEEEDKIGTDVNENAQVEVTGVAVELPEVQDTAEDEEFDGETRRILEDITGDDDAGDIEDKQNGGVVHEGAKEEAAVNIEQNQKTGVDNAATLLAEQKQGDIISKDTKQETAAEFKVPEESEQPTFLEHSPTSDKMVDSEERIRNKLNALCTIIGYTASPRASLVEELKALYIFTGVEPPESLNDPADLVEVDEKLRFLMSIVGVK